MFQLKLDLQFFANANDNAVKYAELTDEIIADVAKNLELFVPSEEYWDKFAHHSIVPKGHRTFQVRRLIPPKVREEDIVKRAEFVAPRPTKIAVATFSKTVDNYGDKAIYSKEDIQFHFDNTVNAITATLKEIAVQKLDIIKGKEFLKSKATVSYDTSMIKTAQNAAIILRKNKVKRWENGLYLAHVTPEALQKLQGEIEAKGLSIPEKIKVTINGKLEELDHYGDFIYSVTDSDLMYKNASTQYIVYMGRRGVDGTSPVDVAKLEGESGIQLINKGLGTGILTDVDGKLTTDDNNQQGVVAINMDGLGAAVSDDLCILDCEVSINEIAGTVLDFAEKTGKVSTSPTTSTVAVSAVKAADGASIASPTVVIKKKNSSGASVTASSGVYPVVAGDTYYYSVAASNYTTVTGTFVANAGANTLIVPMVAS